MARYAAATKVSSDASQAEIKRTVSRYGAKSFASFEDQSRAAVMFEVGDRRIRFHLALPDPAAKEFTHSSRGKRPPDLARKDWEQACRARWRALLLAIKAKLESVASGIETFDEAFMPHIVLPEGDTMGERLGPRIDEALAGRPLPPLLPGPKP